MRYEIPAIVRGQLVTCDDVGRTRSLQYGTGAQIVLPDLDRLELSKALPDPTGCAGLDVDEVTSMMARVGAYVLEGHDEFTRLLRVTADAGGFNERTLMSDYYAIFEMMADQTRLYSILDTELGTFHAMDEWLPSEANLRKAVPRGLIYHVLVGNVPAAALYSLARGSLVRCATVAKTSTRDPVSALAYALAFHRVDPEHPLTRALTVGYWTRDSDLHHGAMNAANGVSVWGGEEAVSAVRRQAPSDCPVLEFGPKASLALIDATKDSASDAARKLVADVHGYDQEACFSPQLCFVKGDVAAFTERLHSWMAHAGATRPRGRTDYDQLAGRRHLVQRARLLGASVTCSDAGESPWTIIIASDVDQVESLRTDHPLAATLVVLGVTDWSEALRFVDRTTQTVGLHPWALQSEVRDAVAFAGADRLCEVGRASRPRAGFTHDGYLALQWLVRWVSIDRPNGYRYKHWYAAQEELDDVYFGTDPDILEPPAAVAYSGGER